MRELFISNTTACHPITYTYTEYAKKFSTIITTHDSLKMTNQYQYISTQKQPSWKKIVRHQYIIDKVKMLCNPSWQPGIGCGDKSMAKNFNNDNSNSLLLLKNFAITQNIVLYSNCYYPVYQLKWHYRHHNYGQTWPDLTGLSAILNFLCQFHDIFHSMVHIRIICFTLQGTPPRVLHLLISQTNKMLQVSVQSLVALVNNVPPIVVNWFNSNITW